MKRFANISTLNVVLGILAFAAFVAFGLAGTANAEVLNVQFVSPAGLYSGVGPAGGGAYWNCMNALTDSSLLYSDSTAATGISAAFSGTINGTTPEGLSNGPGCLVYGYFFRTTTGHTGTVTISGLSASSTYDVYAYADVDPAWSWYGSTISVSGATSPPSWTDAKTGVTAYLLGSNYQEFAGLSPTGSGTIAISFTWPGDYGYLNAISLVDHATQTPEPSTLALLGAGLAGLLCYAWRKRR
jgi:hypothetical protein